ncbi:hypothetical protein F4781DRAFT_438045 [Annulohypoxylon bovei var. microspora]|nr:hypothetical protein F4781DRAFT_438045 [Annulohypoxylon bovei var. microspora]
MAINRDSKRLGTHASVLQELIGEVTDVEPSNDKANLSLEELGLDSIAAVQLANELLLRLQLQIHPDELFNFSLDILIEHVQKSSPASTELQVTATGSPPLSRSFDPFEILAQSDSIYEAAAHSSGFAGYWSSVSPLQNDLLVSYINEAFITLGVNLSEQPHGVETPIIPCIPKYDCLMKRLLDILESRYIVRQRGGKVLRESDRIDVDTSSRLGKLDPLSVLFGSVASRQIMDNFYHGAPMMAAHTEQLVSFFVSLAQGMAAGSQTPTRILEVSAGTDGTTAPLVAALGNAKVPVNYTFTDFWASIREQYDIVVGTNVVHATRDHTATCRPLREALRPGGILVLSELTRPVDWYDICFGLLDDRWLADGGKGYAIQPATVWMDAFEMAGFKSTGHSKGNSEEANTQQPQVACTKY